MEKMGNLQETLHYLDHYAFLSTGGVIESIQNKPEAIGWGNGISSNDCGDV